MEATRHLPADTHGIPKGGIPWLSFIRLWYAVSMAGRRRNLLPVLLLPGIDKVYCGYFSANPPEQIEEGVRRLGLAVKVLLARRG